MFSVHVILVGVGDKLAAIVKQELANQSAVIEAEYRDADTAVDGLKATRSDRRLLIVHVESALDLKQLRWLVETLRGWPMIALVESKGNSELILQANRAGASQVVPLPLEVADLRAALNCLASQDHSPAKKSSVIAFTGSSAGCGVTTLATNVAFEIAVQRKQHTILIETAQQMGVIATNLDLVPACTLADLLAETGQIDGELLQHALLQVADNFELLAASQGVIQQKTFPLAGVVRIIDYIRTLAEIIILDVPCTYTEFQFEILGIADQVVLVGEQSIASIRTLKLILDALPHGTKSTKIHLVINRYDPHFQGLEISNLAKTLGLTEIQTIPDDRPSVLTAANEGKLLRLAMPHSPVLPAINKLVDQLLGVRDRTEKSSGPKLLRRLFNAFSK
jgi:pilus assembly protein CpaE